jgi:hypothetical protein
VQFALEFIDLEVADWWRKQGGEIQSRSAAGWLTFWRDNRYSFMENGRPVIVVDENYTVEQTAEALRQRPRRPGAPNRRRSARM